MSRLKHDRAPGPCPFCGRPYRTSMRRHLRRGCLAEPEVGDPKRGVMLRALVENLGARLRARGWERAGLAANLLKRMRADVPVRRRPAEAMISGSVRWGLWAPAWAVAIAACKSQLSLIERKSMIYVCARAPEARDAIAAVMELGSSRAAWDMMVAARWQHKDGAPAVRTTQRNLKGEPQ